MVLLHPISYGMTNQCCPIRIAQAHFVARFMAATTGVPVGSLWGNSGAIMGIQIVSDRTSLCVAGALRNNYTSPAYSD